VKAAGSAIADATRHTFGRKLNVQGGYAENPVDNRLTEEQRERCPLLAVLEGMVSEAMECLFVKYGFPLQPLSVTRLIHRSP
jgi:hypothetical protein